MHRRPSSILGIMVRSGVTEARTAAIWYIDYLSVLDGCGRRHTPNLVRAGRQQP